MNPHFFTAPFFFAFIWFRVQGSGGGFAAFFRRWYSRIVAFPSRGRLTIRKERSPQSFEHFSPLRTH